MRQAQPARFFLGEFAIIVAGFQRHRVLVFLQFRADVFETGQRLDAAQAKFLRDRLLQIGRDKGLDDDAAADAFSAFSTPCSKSVFVR